MTEAQGAELLAAVAALGAQVGQLVFLVHVCAVTLGLVFGSITWRLIVLAKNHKEIW